MSPSTEYDARLAARTSTHDRRARQDANLSYGRLAVFAASAVTVIAGFRGAIPLWWLTLPVVVFLWLVRRHDRAIRERDQASRAIAFYARGRARLTDTWAGGGASGEQFATPDHPYAVDLDLFGRGSLFELLSIARTRMGEERLAQWLLTAAAPADIAARQLAVGELASKLDFRERLTLAGSDVGAAVDAATLTQWAEAPRLLARWMQFTAALLTAATLASAALWGATGNPQPLVAIVVIELLLFATSRRRMHQVLHAAGGWSHDLDLLAHALDRIENEAFVSPRLAELRSQLHTTGFTPSRAIRRLHRLAEMHDWQHNMLFAIVAIPLLWDVHLAFAMEAWRQQFGPRVRVWLETVGDFEALSSLATYAYEHPEDRFPELDAHGDRARFVAAALGHPLLPAARMVRNDVTLAATRLLVVSGSNMSGKSTLLRTIGVNVVLALAGAPVRARALTLTPLALGATLRIQDSLQEGRSRFYAEISRIRQLADLAAGRPPLLFLLDELFHGTNSHDRLVGAAGVLRQLVDRGAIGLVTTHDLALTGVAEQLAPLAANVHFEDRFENGEMVFDYRMRSGPVTHSNAIALMRAVGLPVGEPGPSEH